MLICLANVMVTLPLVTTNQGNVNLDYLLKVVSARFFHCKVTILLQLIDVLGEVF